jgi:hypothetical protein
MYMNEGARFSDILRFCDFLGRLLWLGLRAQPRTSVVGAKILLGYDRAWGGEAGANDRRVNYKEGGTAAEVGTPISYTTNNLEGRGPHRDSEKVVVS